MRIRLPLDSGLVLAVALVGCQPSAGPEPATAPTDLPAPPPEPATPPESPPPAAAQGATLFVDHEVVACEGAGPMTCLRIRPSESDEWELLYDPIVGFTHEPGHAYELRVERRSVPSPAADAPSFRYHLLEIVSKRAVP